MLTLTQVKNTAKECTAQLNELGYKVPTDIQFRISPRMTRALGNCSCKVNRFTGIETGYVIKISADMTSERLPETMMHELIHATVGVRAGHGWKFQSVGQVVNRKFGYHVSTYATSADAGVAEIRQVRAQRLGHTVTCTSCGKTQTVTARHGIFQHPERYRCHCGGSLEVK
jgi:predicted SprT family Zn-dependent metalloprotease